MLCKESTLCPLLDGETSWMGQGVSGEKSKGAIRQKNGAGGGCCISCGKAVERAGSLLWEVSKWWVQTSLAFTDRWSTSLGFCKLGWLSRSLKGQKVLIQQSRWAVTAPAKAGGERSTGKSRRGGNRLMRWAPRECEAIAKVSWGRGVSPNRYKPLLSISWNWFLWGYFIASPPTPSKVTLVFTTDAGFLWGYQSSPEEEGGHP